MTPTQQLQSGIQALGLDLSAEQQTLLLAYTGLLKKWNKTYNLTALRDEAKMVSYHLLDSLTLLPYIRNVQTLADIGSGGGMPGIPAAICRPDLQMTLVDANTKKTAFLQQAAIELGLDNVSVFAGRVENLHQTADIITSRAFAELADFVSLTRHLLHENSIWAAMKGAYPQDELFRLPENVEAYQTDRLSVPMLDAERHMVLLRPKKGTNA